eukprot:1071364-Prymnesium_polylepis.1
MEGPCISERDGLRRERESFAPVLDVPLARAAERLVAHVGRVGTRLVELAQRSRREERRRLDGHTEAVDHAVEGGGHRAQQRQRDVLAERAAVVRRRQRDQVADLLVAAEARDRPPRVEASLR